ncbi:MAG: UPF0149 family protein [Rhodanobacteraceae bacterium]
MPALNHDELGRALIALGSGVGASDLHGSLIGYLCGGGNAGAEHWVDALALDLGEPQATRSLLATRLHSECCAELDDPELGFEPLLPNAEAPLASRADALVDWCRGFLGGVGLAGGAAAAAKSADGAEILHDFGDIARSRFETGNSEDDEIALAEVVEFVRIGVLLLYAETTRARQSATVH